MSPTFSKASSSSTRSGWIRNFLAVVGLILVALIFDYINGFHDAANSIATVVSTRVLSPGKAVIWAAVLQLRRRVPVRHRRGEDGRRRNRRYPRRHLLGHLRGADWRHRLGPDHVVLRAADQLVARADRRLCRRRRGEGGICRDHRLRLDQDADLHRPRAAHRHGAGVHAHAGDPVDVQRVFAGSRRPLVPAAAAAVGGCFSLGHGGNDAQKTMGIIAGVLVAGGYLNMVNGQLPIPFWVDHGRHTPRSRSARCRAAGGSSIRWDRRSPSCSRSGASRLKPRGAIALFTATHLGIPVSTTHTITGAIIGVGATRRLSAVRWGVAGRIVWAWILTIPAAAALRGGRVLDRFTRGRAVIDRSSCRSSRYPYHRQEVRS